MSEIMCWDHCNTCNKSQNRFWVKDVVQFEKERAETLGHKCSFCGGLLVSYSEKPLEKEKQKGEQLNV